MKLRLHLTAKQRADDSWTYAGQMRNCGSNILWAMQKHSTGQVRYVRPSNTEWGDAASGKTIIRYCTPRN